MNNTLEFDTSAVKHKFYGYLQARERRVIRVDRMKKKLIFTNRARTFAIGSVLGFNI